MTTMSSQITSLTVVYSIVYSGRSKETSKLRVTGLWAGNSPGPVNSPHKGPVTRNMFPFDDVIMQKVTFPPFPRYLSINKLSWYYDPKYRTPESTCIMKMFDINLLPLKWSWAPRKLLRKSFLKPHATHAAIQNCTDYRAMLNCT